MVFNTIAIKNILRSTFNVNVEEVCEEAHNGQVAVDKVKENID